MQAAFETIKQLVADFKAQESAYLSPSYQESQIRQDFIDKFFTALGWDVAHNIQKNPYQQEVHIENKVHMAGSQRRADYAFFFAPNFRDPKFFVEAKKPSRNLANADDYYQTIRYGWNANTPIAVLTDFEEFHILDCRYKPDIKGVMGQKIEYFHYSDYANEEKFACIYWLFSREAVASGSIEKRAAELPKPRGKAIQRGLFKGGYQPVDEAFLEDLDEYREVLAKAFKKSNPDLQSEELTEGIQRTIDRLVFIRFLEDKQIEEPEIINLRSKKSAWKGFLDLCKRLDPKYNGLVFKPHKLLDGKEFIPPDDEEFVRICDELADPSSPYNFDQIPISILGSIYERFLGKVVHATDKRVKVEEKPEVRKAGGVYYTPEYIVRYIVNETVGKLIEGKTLEAIAQMTFADIACGSGSFLIEVYNQLLDYHLRFYIANPIKQKEADVFERDGKLHLTVKKKKEILLNNIFGVDIDFQATEVTQLSLYLKLLEDVTMHDAHQFGMFKETILPDLRQNIINGNSLIGRDIIDGQLFADLDENKLKPMNFEDAFPVVMKRGGFDAVVGNPPYVRQESLGKIFKEYVLNRYKCFVGTADLYVYFIEKAHTILRNKGYFGMICSGKFMRTSYGMQIRSYLFSQTIIREIIDFGELPVFQGASTFPIVLITQRGEIAKQVLRFLQVKSLKFSSLKDEVEKYSGMLDNSSLNPMGWSLASNEIANLINKLKSKGVPLGKYLDGEIYRGILTGLNEAFLIDGQTRETILSKDKAAGKFIKRFAIGDDIRKYTIRDSGSYLILIPNGWTRKTFGNCIDKWKAFKTMHPSIASHLEPFMEKAQKRLDKGEFWWELRPCDYYKEMEKPKIVWPEIAKESRFAFDDGTYYLNKTCFSTTSSSKYLLGVLNSKTIWLFMKNLCSVLGDVNRGGRLMQQKVYIEQLPIRTINFDDPQDKSRHDVIVKLVEQMLLAKEKLSIAKTEAETNRFEHLCQTLDRQIDEAVYELYGLTEEEIKIVEVK
jgi:type I restriction-modification system DNA methylase subunit